MISAVIFDCDGVLVDSETLAHEIEVELLDQAGLSYTPQDFKARFLGLSDKAFRAALEADAQARLGRSILSVLDGELTRRYHEAMDTRLTEVSGAGTAIASLDRHKAVASSSQKISLEKKLRKTDLWGHFAPHIFSADDVAAAKPAPDLFLLAARSLQIKPEQCLVIEDSLNGVLAAQAAGMQVWGFMGGSHMSSNERQRLQQARVERIVENWAEAAQLFRAL